MDTELNYANANYWRDMTKDLLDNNNIPRTSHKPPLAQVNTRRPQTPQRNRERSRRQANVPGCVTSGSYERASY